MSNLVNFKAKYQYVNLKSCGSYLSAELHNIPTPQWKNTNKDRFSRWHCAACQQDQQFIDEVVSIVKKTHFTTSQKTCSISLQSLVAPPSECCPSPLTKHLIAIARILYHSYGIKILQVDDMKSPQTMVVIWACDNPWLNPEQPYLVQSRKEGFLTDCTLKFGEKLYPVHRTVLAAKSLYFQKMFKSNWKEAELGATIPIIMEGVEEKSVEMLLDYFYTGELDLKDASITRIDNLVSLSSYFYLPHLQQLCFEHLCKSVNVGKFKEYFALARRYNHGELAFAITVHSIKEVTPDNFVELIQAGKSEHIMNIEIYATAALTKYINEIDYEPCGFGKSTKLKDFEKILDAIIKTRLVFLLPPLIAQMRKVLFTPAYRAELEKLIEYLALTCEYQTRFDWLPESIPSDFIDMLYGEVLDSIRSRGTDLYKNYFTPSLIEECFKVAEKYQLKMLKTISNSMLQALTIQVNPDLRQQKTSD